jgi:hypothetical protein
MNSRTLSNLRRSGILLCSPAVVVPLAGSAPGQSRSVQAAPSSPVSSLRVTNVGGVVTAARGSETTAGTAGRPSVNARTMAAAPPPACQDGRYRQSGHAWKTVLRWGYHKASTPRRMSAAAAVHQLRLGIVNVGKGQNNCGLRRQPAVASRYVGRMTVKPNIYTSNGQLHCGKPNTRSTVGWGPLPGNLLGYTCYWWNGKQNMVEADMRLDPSRRTVLHYPARCNFKFDLQSLATHEWGHAFGLLHPGPGHARLTMAHLLPPCSTAPRTLGLGDWRGMRRLYGLR